MEYRSLRLNIEGRVARITLCRPELANRVDQRLLRELDDAVQQIGNAPAVAVALLSAEGADFCAGWEDATRAALQQPEGAVVDPFGSIASLACATVAAISGRSFSAGLELALACDIRIAATDARFAMPEVAGGSMPIGGATQRLPRIAGKAAALSLLLLGDEFDAQRAYGCGLVSRLSDEISKEADTVVTAIASRGPLALRYAKEATVQGIDMTLDQGLRMETDLSILLQTTDDRAEGLRAFFEKRPPTFEGR